MATATNNAGTSVATRAAENLAVTKEMEFTPFMAKEPIKLSIAIVREHVCVPTRSGLKCSDKDAVKFMMLCKARGLNPFEGDAFLIGYESDGEATFSLITSHQAFLKRAETHPEYDGMTSGVIVRPKGSEELVDRVGDFMLETDILLGGWATVHFKNRKYPMQKRLKLSTFSTGRSRWKADPAGMIVKCAEADALRSSFPTLCGGMYMEGEMAAVIDAASHEVSAGAEKRVRPAPLPAPGPAIVPTSGSAYGVAQPVKEAETTDEAGIPGRSVSVDSLFTPEEAKEDADAEAAIEVPKGKAKGKTRKPAGSSSELVALGELMQMAEQHFHAHEAVELVNLRDQICGPDSTSELPAELIKQFENRCNGLLALLRETPNEG